MTTHHATAPASRQTKYTSAVLQALEALKHATNSQIHDLVKQIHPEVSVTTIHRVTSRLAERGVIARAPKTSTAEERYDTDPTPHHHFMCSTCDRLCDIVENEASRTAVDLLGTMSRRCKLAGMVTIQGACEDCAV